jgi:ferric-dicitrate binding protein FerR (iron transport regulator)
MRISLLLFGLALVWDAAASSQALAQGAIRIGAAKAIQNDVEGRLGKSVHKLAVGSDVFQKQQVRTGKDSTARLQFLDETDLSLSPLTQISLDRFVYDPDKKIGQVILNVPRGLVRFVTGSLEKQSYTIRTPVGTIGVRGTTFELLVRFDRMTVLLTDGVVEITVRPRRVHVLDRPGTAITIWPDGRVNGPHNWNRSITEFAALAPPWTRGRAATVPAGRKTVQTPPPRGGGTAQPAPRSLFSPGLLEGAPSLGTQAPAPTGRLPTPSDGGGGAGGGGLR